jgi:hypothetical protein
MKTPVERYSIMRVTLECPQGHASLRTVYDARQDSFVSTAAALEGEYRRQGGSGLCPKCGSGDLRYEETVTAFHSVAEAHGEHRERAA